MFDCSGVLLLSFFFTDLGEDVIDFWDEFLGDFCSPSALIEV